MTTALFPNDQATNDRLLLQEEMRRQDLIDTAVSSFAPQLAGKSGVQAIHLYSTNASLKKVIRESAGSRVIVVEYAKADGRIRKGRNEVQQDVQIWLDIPVTADLVVTKSALNFRTELLAAQLHAMAVVLPEGLDYLYRRLDKQGVLVLVGAEQGRAS